MIDAIIFPPYIFALDEGLNEEAGCVGHDTNLRQKMPLSCTAIVYYHGVITRWGYHLERVTTVKGLYPDGDTTWTELRGLRSYNLLGI